jgi:hypothetical protein
MNYIVARTPNYGISQARIISRIGKRFQSKVVANIVILLVLLTFTSYFATTRIPSMKPHFKPKNSWRTPSKGNLTQEQSLVQTAASLILKYRSANSNLTNQVDSLNQSLISDGRNITAIQGIISSLKSQSSSLQNTVSVLRDNITLLKNKTDTFVIWNVPVNVSSGYFLFETVPDTFDYHDNFTATAPLSVYYLNSTQFVQWYTSKTISGNYTRYISSEKQSDTFTLAEGCGGYVVIYFFSTAGTIRPNVSATYDPAPRPTGSCS